MDDSEAHGPGHRARAPSVRAAHVAQPVGRAACSRPPTGRASTGATEPPGGPHAEVVALGRRRRRRPAGATVWVTLEPCSHHGRTAALRRRPRRRRRRPGASSPSRTPTRRSPGRGIDRLARRRHRGRRSASAPTRSPTQLAPYLTHRRTGRPWVVLKLAATLDGRTAAPDGIEPVDHRRPRPGPTPTGCGPRATPSLVGAGTVRADDPSLTVRDADAARRPAPGRARARRPTGAKVHPCLELDGDLARACSTSSAREGVLQVLVEGGATVAGAFHRAGLVDRYVALPRAGALRRRRRPRPVRRRRAPPPSPTSGAGRIRSVAQLGDDLRIDLDPAHSEEHA